MPQSSQIVRHMHPFLLFALAIISQCIFDTMSTGTGRPNEAATAGPSTSKSGMQMDDDVAKTEPAAAAAGPRNSAFALPIPMVVRWRELPNFGYLQGQELLAGNIGNGRFQIRLFPTNSRDKEFGKKSRRTQPPSIRATTSHYDAAIVSGVSKSWVEMVTNKAATTDGYDGLSVEIRMQILTKEKGAPWNTLEWNEAQMISKRIEKWPKKGEMLVCDFVDGGTCHTEVAKKETFHQPIRTIVFALSELEEDNNKFEKIHDVECTHSKVNLTPSSPDKPYEYVGNVCPEDAYTLYFQADNKIQIKCDEAIYEGPTQKNVYVIKKHMVNDNQLECQLKLIDEEPDIEKFGIKVSQMRKDLETIEDGIRNQLWASYRLRMTLQNEYESVLDFLQIKVPAMSSVYDFIQLKFPQITIDELMYFNMDNLEYHIKDLQQENPLLKKSIAMVQYDYYMKKHNPDYRRQFMVALKVEPVDAIARRPDGSFVHIPAQHFSDPVAHGSSSSQSVRPSAASPNPTMPTSSKTFGPESRPFSAGPLGGVGNDWLQKNAQAVSAPQKPPPTAFSNPTMVTSSKIFGPDSSSTFAGHVLHHNVQQQLQRGTSISAAQVPRSAISPQLHAMASQFQKPIHPVSPAAGSGNPTIPNPSQAVGRHFPQNAVQQSETSISAGRLPDRSPIFFSPQLLTRIDHVKQQSVRPPEASAYPNLQPAFYGHIRPSAPQRPHPYRNPSVRSNVLAPSALAQQMLHGQIPSNVDQFRPTGAHPRHHSLHASSMRLSAGALPPHSTASASAAPHSLAPAPAKQSSSSLGQGSDEVGKRKSVEDMDVDDEKKHYKNG